MTIIGGQRSVTKDYFTVDEAAGILRVSPRTIRDYLIAKGKLKAFKVGKEYRINEVEIQRFITDQENKGVREKDAD